MAKRNSKNQTGKYIIDTEPDEEEGEPKQAIFEVSKEVSESSGGEQHLKVATAPMGRESLSKSANIERSQQSIMQDESKRKGVNSTEDTGENNNSMELNRKSRGSVRGPGGGASSSMMQLIQSDFFNIHMLMGYLHKQSSDDIIAQLIERLEQEPPYVVDFYIQQLW